MHTIINYIIESSAVLGILSLFYLLVLRQSTHLQFKRWFLLTSIVFAALVPLGNFTIALQANQTQATVSPAYYMLETFTVTAGEMTEIATPIVESHAWIKWFYAIGFGLLLIRLIMGLVRIGLMRNLFSSTKSNKYRLFITGGSYHPFSFFHWVFIPKPLWENGNGRIILKHEQEHSKQWHSVDILMLELILIIQWFNPFSWVIRKEIKNNHEFLADRAVINNGISRAEYFKSMLFPIIGNRFEMANNFNVSITKKRIKMMKSDNNKKNLVWLSSLSLAIIAVLFLVFACETDKLVEQYTNPQTAFVLNGQLVLPQEVLQGNDANSEANNSLVRVMIDGQEHFLNPNLSADISYAKVISPEQAKSIYNNLELPEKVNQVVLLGEKKAEDKDEAFMVVEKMPSFPGGNKAMMQYLAQNIKYPIVAQEAGIQGRVYVSFVVGKDGIIKDVQTARSVDPSLDTEAMRVVSKMPLWEPGTQRGKNVNVKYMLPINFALQGGEEKAIAMQVVSGGIKLTAPEQKDLSFEEAKEYICKRSHKIISISATDDLNRLTEFKAYLKANTPTQFEIENRGNQVTFEKDFNSSEEVLAEKEAVRAISDEPLKINIHSKSGSEQKKFTIINAVNSNTLPTNKKLEKYYLETGGKITYYSKIKLNTNDTKEVKNKEVVVVSYDPN